MMSRLHMQNFTIIGQGVPEISVRIHTQTNYFSNIDSKRWNPDYLLEIRDQTFRNDRRASTVISSPLTVIIFNKDFDLILKESHASFIRFLDTFFSSLCLTTRPVTARSFARPPGFSHFVPFASVNPERKLELA